MFFRCFIISRTSIWGRSINSLTSLHSRSHHAIGNALYRLNGSDQNEKGIQSSPHHRMILSQISARNLSFIPSIFASSKDVAASATTAPAIETVDSLQNVLAGPIDGTLIQQLAANGEPTFSSLGLGGYSLSGLFQWGLEFIHVSLDLPWYATIALSSVIIRIMLTPLKVTLKQDAAMMQDARNRLIEAQQMGDAVKHAQAEQLHMQLIKSQRFGLIWNFLFVRVPIFSSVLSGTCRMVDTPVLNESLQTGGLWWFTDLTMIDPYYLLPLLTSGTLALSIHLYTNAFCVPGQKTPRKILFLRCIPIVIFPFVMNLPAAMGVYLVTGNTCSLIQDSLFKMPKVRRFFNIPQILEQPVLAKGASNLKSLRGIEDPRRLDEISFKRAGTGPLIRTYKVDPTKKRKIE